MGQNNSQRIEHTLTGLPNTFRDDILSQILNDLDEESAGKGFSEVTYITNVFVSKIETWDGPGKNYKLSEVDFTYSPFPFIDTIVKTIFGVEGAPAVATITATFTYNPNKTLQDVNVATARV